MKSLGLEIPEYDINVDPTKNQMPESIIEWKILKKDLREIKYKYDTMLKDYKKRKAEEKLNNGAVKMPKKEKWKDEDKVAGILKLKSAIRREKNIEKIDLTLDEENDDIFVE